MKIPTLELTSDFAVLITEANARYNAMTPEQQAAMWQAQRESFARAMAPCEHGIADFDCRSVGNFLRGLAVEMGAATAGAGDDRRFSDCGL
mgnify:CR=1 FL=1